MMKRIKVYMLLAVAWLGAGAARGQQVALKTNLLYDAALTPNVGLEAGLGRQWTLQLTYGLNPWTLTDGRKARHWVLSPELRYWFCSVFNGHFVGLHGLGGEFNMEGLGLPAYVVPFGALTDLSDRHYEGWYAGAGLSYGYQWILGRHWNLEASVGLGAAYLDYSKYRCKECGFEEEPGHRWYVGLTREVISLLYIF